MSRWLRLTLSALVVGVIAGVGVALLAGGDGSDGGGGPFWGGPEAAPTTEPPDPVAPVVAMPAEETAVVEAPVDDAAARAVATSAALYREAPIVVTASATDLEAQALGASAAVRLGVPLLLVPEAAFAPATTDGPAATEAPGGAPGAANESAGVVAETVVAQSTPDTTAPGDTANPGATEGPTDAATAPPPPDAAVTAELDRLATTTVLAVGAEAARWAEDLGVDVVTATDATGLARAVGEGLGAAQTLPIEEVPRAVAGLPRDGTPTLVVASPTEAGTPEPGGPTPGLSPAPDAGTLPPGDATLPPNGAAAPLSDLAVILRGGQEDVAATATARAAGARLLFIPGYDPRADQGAIAALAAQPVGPVLAVGGDYGPPERLRRRIAVASTGVELPGGGQVVYPHRRMVALYGHPGTAALGVLGEQPVESAIARANEVAAPYGPLSDVPVVPAFEIITTIASSAAGEDGDYSDEATIDHIRPWVDAAREAGVYVVLDLQPGRTDFLTQAQRYTELLAEPHVGLALDPEWRLEPDQVHLRQIGSVGIEEVNEVAAWLAQLTRERQLPQKLLILHQFRLSMIEGRERVDTSHDELSVLIHADGNGSLGLKLESWNALTAEPPGGVWWGWKNFYDEDSPTPSPEQTMAVEPTPLFISYQ